MNSDRLERANLSVTLEPLVEAHASGDDVRAAFDRLAASGFRSVQLSATLAGMRPRDMDASARRDILVTLRRRGISVSGLDFFIPPQHYAEPASADRAWEALRQAMHLCADLNRAPVSVCFPSVESHDADPLKSAIESACETAERLGVTIADHQVPLVHREGLLIGIGIDPALWLANGEQPTVGVLASPASIASARLCDLISGQRAPIGLKQGKLDVLAYQATLAVVGYQRPVVIDARQWRDPWRELQLAAQTWQNIRG